MYHIPYPFIIECSIHLSLGCPSGFGRHLSHFTLYTSEDFSGKGQPESRLMQEQGCNRRRSDLLIIELFSRNRSLSEPTRSISSKVQMPSSNLWHTYRETIVVDTRLDALSLALHTHQFPSIHFLKLTQSVTRFTFSS